MAAVEYIHKGKRIPVLINGPRGPRPAKASEAAMVRRALASGTVTRATPAPKKRARKRNPYGPAMGDREEVIHQAAMAAARGERVQHYPIPTRPTAPEYHYLAALANFKAGRKAAGWEHVEKGEAAAADRAGRVNPKEPKPPRWVDSRSQWMGGDTRRLYAFTDTRTGRVHVHPGQQYHRALRGLGPALTVRPATKAEAEAAGWPVRPGGWKVNPLTRAEARELGRVEGALDDASAAIRRGNEDAALADVSAARHMLARVERENPRRRKLRGKARELAARFIAEEMRAGRPQKQAIAIGIARARRATKQRENPIGLVFTGKDRETKEGEYLGPGYYRPVVRDSEGKKHRPRIPLDDIEGAPEAVEIHEAARPMRPPPPRKRGRPRGGRRGPKKAPRSKISSRGKRAAAARRRRRNPQTRGAAEHRIAALGDLFLASRTRWRETLSRHGEGSPQERAAWTAYRKIAKRWGSADVVRRQEIARARDEGSARFARAHGVRRARADLHHIIEARGRGEGWATPAQFAGGRRNPARRAAKRAAGG